MNNRRSDRGRAGDSLGRRVGVLASAVALPVAALVIVASRAEGDRPAGPTVTLPPTTIAAAPAPPAALNTPLLSYRRVAPLLAGDSNLAPLRQQLDAFAPQLGERSCLAVAVGGVDVTLYNADLPVIPASNQKLITAAAALHVLGPDFTFTTTAAAVSVEGGVVRGDLYLVGGGDPGLSTPDYPDGLITQTAARTDLNQLVANLQAAGVTAVEGSVVGDASRYDDEYSRPGWDPVVIGTEVSPYDGLLVNDSRSLGSEWQYDSDPATSAAAEFTRLLAAAGITVGGDPIAGAAPGDATAVATIQSQPLSAVVGGMLATSDNNTAEMLIKELGVAAGGAGTSDAGIGVTVTALGELGIDTTALVIVDGSGLSTDNRLTCRSLLGVLARHTPTDALGAGLPVAGRSGTLTEVFVGEAVEGRLIAKTGNLQNIPFDTDPPAVRSLSGYLPAEGVAPIEFALVLNQPGPLDQANYRPLWYGVAGVLATYPAAPTPDLGPR